MRYILLYITLSWVYIKEAFAAQSSGASLDFGLSEDGRVKDSLQGSKNPLEDIGQVIISNFIGFLYLLAVVYALWGGFQILTAGGEEEKVNKGKDIIIQALIGLVVIFLANSIVLFVTDGILVDSSSSPITPAPNPGPGDGIPTPPSPNPLGG